VENDGTQSTFLGASATRSDKIIALVESHQFEKEESTTQIQLLEITSAGKVTSRQVLTGIDRPYQVVGVMSIKSNSALIVSINKHGEAVITVARYGGTPSSQSRILNEKLFTPISFIPLQDGNAAVLGRVGARGTALKINSIGEFLSKVSVLDPDIQILYDAVDTEKGLVFLGGNKTNGSQKLWIGSLALNGRVMSKELLTDSHGLVFGLMKAESGISILFDEMKPPRPKVVLGRLVENEVRSRADVPFSPTGSGPKLVSSTQLRQIIAGVNVDRELLVRAINDDGGKWDCFADIHESQQDTVTNFFPLSDNIAFTQWAVKKGKLQISLKLLPIGRN
jgi:hypothetical protein